MYFSILRGDCARRRHKMASLRGGSVFAKHGVCETGEKTLIFRDDWSVPWSFIQTPWQSLLLQPRNVIRRTGGTRFGTRIRRVWLCRGGFSLTGGLSGCRAVFFVCPGSLTFLLVCQQTVLSLLDKLLLSCESPRSELVYVSSTNPPSIGNFVFS